MFIYDYLFLHGYLLALRSRSNRDTPFFIPLMLVMLCAIMHLFTISMLFNGMKINAVVFKSEARLYWVIFLMLTIAIIYLYKDRYKKIVINERRHPPIWLSIIIVMVYYLVSAGLMLLSALFKNKDWIFS